MALTHRFMRSGQQKFCFHGRCGAGYLIGTSQSVRHGFWLPWGNDNWLLKVRVERKVHKICSWLRMHAVASMEDNMGRAILLWLLGVPIPIIILLALFWH